MGQRLNIEIVKNGKTLANCYYHWSAYSGSSVKLAKTIIDNIDKIKYESNLLTAIKLLESTGAGLTEDEIEYSKSIDELKNANLIESKNRNIGLIAISEDGINQTRYWQEYALYIYLDEDRMSFGVYHKASRWDWENDMKEEEKTVKYDDVEKININFDDIKFSDIEEFQQFIIRSDGYFRTAMNPCNVYQTIE